MHSYMLKWLYLFFTRNIPKHVYSVVSTAQKIFGFSRISLCVTEQFTENFSNA